MRIGAIYVPLDLRNPLERLSAIVKAAQPSALLAHTSTVTLTPSLGGSRAIIIDVSPIAMPPASASLERVVLNRANPDSPAVLQFTSGTTGSKCSPQTIISIQTPPFPQLLREWSCFTLVFVTRWKDTPRLGKLIPRSSCSRTHSASTSPWTDYFLLFLPVASSTWFQRRNAEIRPRSLRLY